MNKITQFVVFVSMYKIRNERKTKTKPYKINDRFSDNKQQYIDKDSIGYLHSRYKVKIR